MGASSSSPVPEQIISALDQDDPQALSSLLKRDRLWRHWQLLLCLSAHHIWRQLPHGLLQLICAAIPEYDPPELDLVLGYSGENNTMFRNEDLYRLGGLKVVGMSSTSRGEQVKPLKPEYKWLAYSVCHGTQEQSLPELAWGHPGQRHPIWPRRPRILEWLESDGLSKRQLAAWIKTRQVLEDREGVPMKLEWTPYVVDDYTSR